MVTSYGSSPLTMTGLDGGVTYGVIINVFDGNQVVLRCETVVKLITVMTNNSGEIYIHVCMVCSNLRNV